MENTNTVTVKEIFDQIVALQKDMFGKPEYALCHIKDTLRAAASFGEGVDLQSEDFESAVAKACESFAIREVTYQRMLALYEKMYDDCKNGIQ